MEPRAPADELDPIEATVIPHAVATSVHVAARRGEFSSGDDVLIFGAGGGVRIHLGRRAVTS